MKQVVIASEAIALVLLAIILYGSVFEVKIRNKKMKVYVMFVLTCMIGTIVDMTAWIVNGHVAYANVVFISNLLAFIFGYAMEFAYTLYLIEYIRQTEKLSRYWELITIVIFVGGVLFALVGAFISKLFYLDNGAHYITGEWYFLSQIPSILFMLFGLMLLMSYHNTLGMHDMIAFLIYLVAPIISLELHFVFPQVSVTFIVIALVQTLMYVMLQAERETEFRLREKILMEASYTDSLTMLQNRRAYDRKIDDLEHKGAMGVLFCDLNALKYVNDHHGHTAGDRLIMTLTDILKEHFSYENIFRISGDEFVVFLKHQSEASCLKQVEKLRKSLKAGEHGATIAAIGTAYGSADDVLELLKNAENAMYDEKRRFYEEYPKYKRG